MKKPGKREMDRRKCQICGALPSDQASNEPAAMMAHYWHVHGIPLAKYKTWDDIFASYHQHLLGIKP